MGNLNPGQLAKSLAGHDKDSIYVVLQIEGQRCSLVDGRLRKMTNPKIKNRKHLQPIHTYASELLGVTDDEMPTTNEQVARAIKRYMQRCGRDER